MSLLLLSNFKAIYCSCRKGRGIDANYWNSAGRSYGFKTPEIDLIIEKKLIDIINSWKGCGNAQEIKGGQ